MTRIDCQGIPAGSFAGSQLLQEARRQFVEQGFVILDHVIAAPTVRSLREEFVRQYARYFDDREADDSLEVGERRFMVPIGLIGGFADPAVFANPYVVALVREVLDQDAILEAYGAVVSLSGSAAQPAHQDAAPLFNSALSTVLPAHALTCGIPLVEMNDLHGTTALWPQSHRSAGAPLDDVVTPERPTIPVGSCLLWDFRLFHSGTANRSAEHRPMLYATYARRWYQDPVNFRKRTIPRLVFEPAFLEGLADDTRNLFAHVR